MRRFPDISKPLREPTPGERISAVIVVILAIVFVLGFLGFTRHALAKDDGRWKDDPNHAWFDSLKSKKGVPCCSTSDGVKLDDPDWRANPDGTYSVKIDGEWLAVPPEAVLDASNRVGFAVVWRFAGKILCFLPGAGI